MATKPHKHHEHAYRSAAKAVSYRVVISIQLFIITWLVTGSVQSALQLTGWTALVSTLVYYIHERVWAHIAWGRTKPNKPTR